MHGLEFPVAPSGLPGLAGDRLAGGVPSVVVDAQPRRPCLPLVAPLVLRSRHVEDHTPATLDSHGGEWHGRRPGEVVR